MKRAWLLLACLAFACDDQPNDPPKADMADMTPVVDMAPADGDTDGGGDAVVEGDAAPDAAPDAARDMAVDPDAAPDAAPDATPDAVVDAAVDAVVDAVVDAEVDAVIDAVVDAALPVLEVRILQPANGALVNTTPIPVSGRVALPIDALTLGGVAIEPGVDGAFAADVPLDEGANEIVAQATRGDETVEARVTVTLDSAAPVIAIVAPADGSSTPAERVVVEGTVDDPTAVVVVNGIAAAVADGRFTLEVAEVNQNTN